MLVAICLQGIAACCNKAAGDAPLELGGNVCINGLAG